MACCQFTVVVVEVQARYPHGQPRLPLFSLLVGVAEERDITDALVVGIPAAVVASPPAASKRVSPLAATVRLVEVGQRVATALILTPHVPQAMEVAETGELVVVAAAVISVVQEVQIVTRA